MAHDTRRPGSEASTIDIDEIIDRLYDLISTGKKVPLSNRVMVEEEDIVALVDQLRLAIPIEIRNARRVIQDRQKVLLDAQAEAQKIVGIARERAEYLISDKGLTSEARARSEDFLRQSREQRQRSINEIETFAMRVLDQAERALKTGLTEVEQAKGQLGQTQVGADR